MTEISEAAKAKAKLVLDPDKGLWNAYSLHGVARFIQEVSDAVKRAIERTNPCHRINIEVELEPFILPEPVDPLVEAVRGGVADPEVFASVVRQRLAQRGFKIVAVDAQ